MPALNPKPADQQRIVARLAATCHVPIDEMAALYAHELAGLASGAGVTRYLHIFAMRNVLAIMRQRGRDEQASASGRAVLAAA